MSEPESLAEYIRDLEDQIEQYQTMHKRAVENLNHATEVIIQLRKEVEELRKSKPLNIDYDDDLPSLLQRQV